MTGPIVVSSAIFVCAQFCLSMTAKFIFCHAMLLYVPVCSCAALSMNEVIHHKFWNLKKKNDFSILMTEQRDQEKKNSTQTHI